MAVDTVQDHISVYSERMSQHSVIILYIYIDDAEIIAHSDSSSI
jgi:hypothetical protein